MMASIHRTQRFSQEGRAERSGCPHAGFAQLPRAGSQAGVASPCHAAPGRNRASRPQGYAIHRPTEDVRIANCTFADSSFACIGIGSETSAGIRDVPVEHCKCTGARTYAVYIKTRADGALPGSLTGRMVRSSISLPACDASIGRHSVCALTRFSSIAHTGIHFRSNAL
jgi:hypothetical protein